MEACRVALTHSNQHFASSFFTFMVAELVGMGLGFYALIHAARAGGELEALFVEPAYRGEEWGEHCCGRRLTRPPGTTLERSLCEAIRTAAAFYRLAGLTDRGVVNQQAYAGAIFLYWR